MHLRSSLPRSACARDACWELESSRCRDVTAPCDLQGFACTVRSPVPCTPSSPPPISPSLPKSVCSCTATVLPGIQAPGFDGCSVLQRPLHCFSGLFNVRVVAVSPQRTCWTPPHVFKEVASCAAAKAMKRHLAPASKARKSVGEGAARSKSKLRQPSETVSKRKGTDGGKRKRTQEGEVKQTAKKRGKQYREQSPEEMASGKTKRVKKATSKTADWQPLSESSREILDSMMDSVILSILSQELIAKEDIQKHLDLLKERLQRHFKNLKVPSGKLGNLKNVVNLKVQEKQKLASNEESLALLKEEIEKAMQAAEHTDENIQSLQDKIRMLRSELEEEENKAKMVFQGSGRGVLNLPELPTNSLEAPILQEEILKIPNQTGVLQNLNTIQRSAEMRNMLSLLKQAYEKVDSL